MSKFLLSCGGTGGHLAPGIALAEGLAARGHEATLLISHKKIDARLSEKYPHLRFARIPGSPFTWKPAGLARFLVSQSRGLWFSLRLVRSTRPAAIVGFGGFTTAAIIVAGALQRVPVALHEANRVPGRAIRLLGRLARRVYVPRGVAVAGVKPAALREVGLPVRREITPLPRAEACAALGLDPRFKVLVIFGGSQGATPLNDWARREMPSLAAQGVQLYCVTGPGKAVAETLPLKTSAGEVLNAVFTPFSDQVAALLSAADLVVARAGAGSIAEMIRCGAPAVLVPYPHAADNHQWANARAFAESGAGLVVDQKDMAALSATVRSVLFDADALARHRAALARLASEPSLEMILDDLESFNRQVRAPSGAGACPTKGDARMTRAARPPLFGRDVTAVHAVGVGGMGLGPLAIYLAGRGFVVSGEDDNLTEVMRAQLVRAGVAITPPGGVPVVCDLVVYSSAISKNHPAYLAATARGIPLARRGEVLAEVTRDRKLIGVCGSHGKTTTTAMIVTALRASGFPAGYVLGGLFADDSVAPASAGENDWVVAEIDESDGTIVRFSPEVTVAVNLDWDHPDHYPQLADLEAAFAALFARTRGAVLVNAACALSARVVANHAGVAKLLRFGRDGDYRGRLVEEGAGELRLELGGRFPTVAATVRAIGEFNATNATAALAAAHFVGADDATGRALAAYPGVRRRQAVLSAADGLTVIEDYAHHPAEIRALVAGLRKQTRGKLILVFQPHRFSRTKQFKDEFAAALTGGDVVGLIDVYGAGEAPIAGGTTADVAARFRVIAPATPLVFTKAITGAC